MEVLHQFGSPRVLQGLLGRFHLHGPEDRFLRPPLLGVLHPGKELEQPQTGRTSDRAPQGGEIEGVGDGERPVEVEENGRDPERSNQRKHLLLRSGGRFSVPSA